ncbi:endo-1,4-beta-xylanase [Marinimicrobium sp. ABcell2]|uniref:endo-1,4-beta-xylanase n=1 Tax=Marinimicrobium sp. ABcell2 TaxID=3069751 RepID=UPI0027B4991D|nr:endo-1,4-beta-xylanase [Marinimicrobium sp. ABcell2]MDQ2077214.1 endo-1,4-beta-xylanase [Marinimicrobium sp. ABcell2]
MFNLSGKFISLALVVLLATTGCSSSSNDPMPPPPTPPTTTPPADDDTNQDQDPEPEAVPAAELDFEHLYELAGFPIGVSVDGQNGMPPQAERPVIEKHFNQLTAGNIMKMSYLHNNWDVYTFDNADRLVEYAAENDMTMHGHALVWHSCYQVPAWARNFEGDKEDFLDRVYEHAETVASHYETNYAGTVVSWDVVNEAFQGNGAYRDPVQNCNSNGEGSVFGYHAEGPEFIEAAFRGARAGAPSADLYYNDFNLVPNGAKLRGGDDTPGVLGMLDDFLERDVPIDGIGFQMHIYIGWPSISNIREAFEQVVERGLKVKITELDVAAYNPYGGESFEPYTQELADRQKQRYCEIVEAYMDVVPEEQRGGFTVWGVSDDNTWLTALSHFSSGNPWPLLFTGDLEPKPAIMGVADALRGRPCS